MNKLLKRIIGGALGLALAIGTGVAVATNSKEASQVFAAAGGTPTGSWVAVTNTSDIVANKDYLLGYVYSNTNYYSKSTSLSSSALQTTSTPLTAVCTKRALGLGLRECLTTLQEKGIS